MSAIFSLAGLLAFLCLAATDICWAVYVSKVSEKNPHKSALWSLGLFLTGGMAVISYTENHWLLIPAALGAYVGTFIGVWWEKRNGS